MVAAGCPISPSTDGGCGVGLDDCPESCRVFGSCGVLPLRGSHQIRSEHPWADVHHVLNFAPAADPTCIALPCGLPDVVAIVIRVMQQDRRHLGSVAMASRKRVSHQWLATPEVGYIGGIWRRNMRPSTTHGCALEFSFPLSRALELWSGGIAHAPSERGPIHLGKLEMAKHRRQERSRRPVVGL